VEDVRPERHRKSSTGPASKGSRNSSRGIEGAADRGGGRRAAARAAEVYDRTGFNYYLQLRQAVAPPKRSADLQVNPPGYQQCRSSAIRLSGTQSVGGRFKSREVCQQG